MRICVQSRQIPSATRFPNQHVAKQCGQIAGHRSQIKSQNARADLKVVLVTEKKGAGPGRRPCTANGAPP